MSIGRVALAQFEIRAIHINGALDEDAYVRPLTARHLALIAELAERADTDEAAGVELVARMVCYCLTDADGQRVYEDDDVDLVLDIPATRLNDLRKIAEAAMELSDLGAGTGPESGN